MKTVLLWLFAIIITLLAAFYQRVTGPTYPKSIKIVVDNKEYKLHLIRSNSSTSDAPVELNINSDIEALLFYRFYPVRPNDEWNQVRFVKAGDKYIAKLPSQPPAGKLTYYIQIKTSKGNYDIVKDNPVVIRFKGDVPALILIPHILLMFFAMFFSNVAGLFAVAKRKYYLRYAYITFALLAVGGMILGPIVQYYAFGDLWTGVPYGWDLTDNKTLIAFVFWIIAVLGQLKIRRPYLTIVAAIIMLLVFTIPHSSFGSELDRSTGTIKQGIIIVSNL
jgi:hypothetical protein